MKKLFTTVILTAFLAGAAFAMAQNTDEIFIGKGKFEIPAGKDIQERKDKLVSFVHAAVEFCKKEGKDKAFEEFNDPKGKFTDGELYIYAYDYSGKCLAHGANSRLIGQNLIEYEDPDGLKIIQALINAAKNHDRGFQPFKWPDPITKLNAPKIGYVEKVDDNYFIGSGIYIENK